MLLFSGNRVSFDRGPVRAAATDLVSSSRLQSSTDEPPPWPQVIVLPIIGGLSIILWAGIGRLFVMLIASQ